MKGWFDAFRTEGGPTLYSYSNRTPVTGDLPTIALYVVFFTLFTAFLIIFPGVRKERFTTFTSVTLSLFVGTVILVTNQGSCWHVSESIIRSDYRSFSTVKIEGRIGVYVGLKHINVTLESVNNPYVVPQHSPSNFSSSSSNNGRPDHFIIDYNERFYWREPEEISRELKDALYKGLPFPILTVLEYFSLDDEGFSWGRMYRLAGYYSSILLWASFGSWLLMNLLLIVVPRYGAYQMIITSALMLSTNLIYYMLLPVDPLHIRFEQHVLEFQFGWSFWLVAIAGSLCGFVGLIIAFVDLMYPHTFSTILEVDYDTPYDRHIIIEESFKGKTKARSLEDPLDTGIGFGRKILRTLSSKRSTANEKGLVNNGFEMDPPKSPWANYNRIMNHQQKRLAEIENNSLISAMAKNPNLARLAAPNHLIMNGGAANGTPGGTHGIKSPKSVSFRRQSRLEQTFDVKKRDDSDDDSISNCSSNSAGQPCDKNIHHFQGTHPEIVNNLNTITEDTISFPKPRLIPRVSYESHNNSNSNSRRGSNESTDNDNHSSSSLSGFSSNSFDSTSKKNRRSEAVQQPHTQEFMVNHNKNNLGDFNNKINDEW